MKRTALFLATNLAVVLVLSVTLRLLGVEPYLNEQGLNLNALLIFAAVFGFGGAFISLALSKWTAKRAVGAQVITQPSTPTEQWLVQTVARQAQAAGIRMPEVAVYESPEVNAFATGMSKNASLIAVSTGLLQQMSREEAEAVLGHEVSHAANGDMVTMALIQGVVNTFVMFLSRVIGHLVDRVVFKTERGHGPAFFVTMIAAELLLGILASIIVMWFSRHREFRADRGGAELAGRRPMIAALHRLAALHPGPLPDKMAAFGIAGGAGGGLKRLFMTHPPLKERIAALENADKETLPGENDDGRKKNRLTRSM
ncbi:protease HtpX [Bosea sp. (in: a-proteobacteria)]|uniref:protease HtpX n=1 Tax=Bosea sp. (in: a-proteobacteria) TaxID=1871050 RepID=UPI003F72514A